jgi:hypothetical protein
MTRWIAPHSQIAVASTPERAPTAARRDRSAVGLTKGPTGELGGSRRVLRRYRRAHCGIAGGSHRGGSRPVVDRRSTPPVTWCTPRQHRRRRRPARWTSRLCARLACPPRRVVRRHIHPPDAPLRTPRNNRPEGGTNAQAHRHHRHRSGPRRSWCRHSKPDGGRSRTRRVGLLPPQEHP